MTLEEHVTAAEMHLAAAAAGGSYGRPAKRDLAAAQVHAILAVAIAVGLALPDEVTKQ